MSGDFPGLNHAGVKTAPIKDLLAYGGLSANADWDHKKVKNVRLVRSVRHTLIFVCILYLHMI